MGPESPSGAVAAVDCGTNSTRLLVIDDSGHPLERRMTITRLGQGVDSARRLERAATGRTLDVLRDYRRVMARHGVRAGRQVATSAVRDATNGDEFLSAASEATGLTTELLSGQEEARLSFAGATRELEPVAGSNVVVDIGGGSTELCAGPGSGSGSPDDLQAVSMDLGCVRVTERYLRHDPPGEAELRRARREVRRELVRAVDGAPALTSLPGGSRLLGLAGTVSTLAMLDIGADTYRRELVHHHVLSLDAVEAWCATLAAEPVAARAERRGVAAGREDVIVGGALILAEVMTALDLARCVASEADILDGMAWSALEAQATAPFSEDDPRRG